MTPSRNCGGSPARGRCADSAFDEPSVPIVESRQAFYPRTEGASMRAICRTLGSRQRKPNKAPASQCIQRIVFCWAATTCIVTSVSRVSRTTVNSASLFAI